MAEDCELIKFLVNNKELTIRTRKENIERFERDDEYVVKYIVDMINANKLTEFGLNAEDIVNLEIVRLQAPDPIVAVASQSEDEVIWTARGKPTQKDKDALQFMLELRGSDKYAALFNNKQHVKMQIWAKIGHEMTAAGYNLGPPGLIPEKLRQKFVNLSRSYNQYNQYVKTTTGTEPKPPPEHWIEMDRILGDKHKSHPKFIKNSMAINEPSSSKTVERENIPDSPPCNNSDENSGSTSQTQNTPIPSVSGTGTPVGSNRFSRVSRTSRPTTEKNALLLKYEEMNKQTLEQNQQQFEVFQKLLEDQNKLLECQNDQREKLINLFSELANQDKKSKKKRRRSSSSSG